MADGDFYLRYYVGHKGKFGHEFLEFEFRPDGQVSGVVQRDFVWCIMFCGTTDIPLSPRAAPFPTSAGALRHAACCVQLRYANNSQYKNDTMIRKEVYCSPAVLEELKRIIADSEARSPVSPSFVWAACVRPADVTACPSCRKNCSRRAPAQLSLARESVCIRTAGLLVVAIWRRFQNGCAPSDHRTC